MWTAEQFAGSNSTQCSRTQLSGPFVCSFLLRCKEGTESKESCVEELCACLRHFSGTACAVCFAGLVQPCACAALRLDAAGGVVGRQRSGLQRVAAQAAF